MVLSPYQHSYVSRMSGRYQYLWKRELDNDLLVYYNNNYNNNNTSIAPISSKRIELSGAPSTGVGQTLCLSTMQCSSTMIRWKGTLRKDKRVWKGEFSNGDGKKLLFNNLTCSESEYQRVGTGMEMHESSMNFNPGKRQQLKTRWTELSVLGC